MKINLSIAICTYNRIDLLKKLLFQLKNQLEQLAKPAIELILIDNNSNDGTKDFALSFKLRNCKFKYVLETAQGLSHARNCATLETKANYILFLDDDVNLEDNFIDKLMANISTLDPKEPIIAGARIKSDLEHYEKPAGLSFQGHYAVSPSVLPEHDFGNEIKRYPFKYKGLNIQNPIGAFMLISTELFQALPRFNIRLGAGTSKFGFGLHEDTEFLRLAKKNNIDMIYWGNLGLSHPVQVARLTLAYFKHWYFQSGKSLYYLAKTKPEIFNTEQAKWIGVPAKIGRFMPKFLAKQDETGTPRYLKLKHFLLKKYLHYADPTISSSQKFYYQVLLAKTEGEIAGAKACKLLLEEGKSYEKYIAIMADLNYS